MKYFDPVERMASAELVREQMWPYQNMGVWFIKYAKKVALWMDLGLGKSVTAGTAMTDLLAELKVNRVLIIAPLRVSKTTWPEQLSEWRHLAGFEYCVLSDDPEDRRETKTAAVLRRSRESRASIHIVNMEMTAALVDHWRRKWPYDMVIIDESSKFKDHASQRFKKLRLVSEYINYMVELTATPASEGYEGLFAQMALLDGGERLGTHITHYRDDYFKQNRWSKKWEIIEKLKPEIDKKISDITLVMSAKEYLPDQKGHHFVPHIIPMSSKFQRQYREMEETSVLELDDVEIVGDNAAAVWSKLLQMASGMVYETWKEPHPTRVGKMVNKRKAHHLHDEKLDELEELIDQLDGKPLLVGYYWEESLDRLTQRFPKAVVADKEGKFKAKWDAGKIQILLAHPMSAGHGLNLQKPTNHMCFFDLHPSLENFLQFIGRLDRQGQLHKVMVHLLLSKGTYDLRVWESLKEKREGEEKLLSRLRYIQRKVRQRFLDDMYGKAS